MPPADDKPEPMNVADALGLLDEKRGYVHCFVNSGGALIGCDWPIATVRELFERHAPEIAGPAAQTMRHGIAVCVADEHARFFATREEWSEDQLKRFAP